MNDAQVTKLIQQALAASSESNEIEFKEAQTALPGKLWREVSCFANTDRGGLIVLGIEKSDRTVLGLHQDTAKSHLVNLSNLFNDGFSYPLRPEYHRIQITGKEVLAVEIPSCPIEYRPFFYKQEGIHRGAYIRDGATARMLTEIEVRRMIGYSRQLRFDTTQAQGTLVKDLDLGKILNVLQGKSEKARRGGIKNVTNEHLKNLAIASKFGKKYIPTVGGYLVFAKKDPQVKQHFHRYLVRCIRYEGLTATSPIIDSQDISGTLDKQIDSALAFVLRNIRTGAKIQKARRQEETEYPAEAVRELIANAVIHRDYGITQTYIQIAIFEDRIEIASPGNLPPEVTEENIREAQVTRNEVIASHLRDLGYLEEYGRGFDIVFDSMKRAGLLPPLLKNSVNQFKVILLGPRVGTLNTRQQIIWKFLLENQKITPQECRELLRDTPRPTINYDLRKLKDAGLIESRGQSYNLEYYLKI